MLHIIFDKYNLLLKSTENTLALPQQIELSSPILDLLSPIAKTDKYIVSYLNNEIPNDLCSSLQLINIRQALNSFEEDLINTIAYYLQLYLYYTSHKFCGNCGNTTTLQQNNKFVICNTCNNPVYPHIAPCIIVRIHDAEDNILMARGVNFAKGVWGLIAGFIEIGETVEEAVRREVKEEVGLEITDIKYWGSQPWPFPSNSLMIGFTAKYQAGTINIDPVEIEQAAFFSRSNLPGGPSASYSIASRMINEYLNS